MGCRKIFLDEKSCQRHIVLGERHPLRSRKTCSVKKEHYNTSFPRTQGEAPSQSYVPLAGFVVDKYLSSLQLQKHLIFVFIFIFEPHAHDPHTTSSANVYTYVILKLHISGQNVSNLNVNLILILHKIFKTFLKISVLKYNFEDHIGDPQNSSKKVASPRASPPPFPRICAKYS